MTQPTQVVFAIASASSEALSKSVDVEVSVDVDVVAVDVAVEVKVEVEVTYKTGWLVVELTPLKNMSQIGLFQPSFGMKIKTYLKPPTRKRFDSFLRLAHLGKRKIIDSKVVPFLDGRSVSSQEGRFGKGFPFLPWSLFNEKMGGNLRSWNFLKLTIRPLKNGWRWLRHVLLKYVKCVWLLQSNYMQSSVRVFVKPSFEDVDVFFGAPSSNMLIQIEISI